MRNLPIVTRSILWTNIIVFLLDMVLRRIGIQLTDIFGLHYLMAQQFHIWQPLTYMFLHADLGHIFCNMFAVLMFAPILEREWGWKRFLTYYLVCGFGAGLIQETVWAMMYQSTLNAMPAMQAAYYINPLVTIGARGQYSAFCLLLVGYSQMCRFSLCLFRSLFVLAFSLSSMLLLNSLRE